MKKFSLLNSRRILVRDFASTKQFELSPSNLFEVIAETPLFLLEREQGARHGPFADASLWSLLETLFKSITSWKPFSSWISSPFSESLNLQGKIKASAKKLEHLNMVGLIENCMQCKSNECLINKDIPQNAHNDLPFQLLSLTIYEQQF